MSLTFEFPNWKVGIGEKHTQEQHSLKGSDAWEADLLELSGEEDEQQEHQTLTETAEGQHADAHTPQGHDTKRVRCDAGQPGEAASSNSSSARGPLAAAAAAALPPRPGTAVPAVVLLMVSSRLSLADTAALACCCRAFYDFLAAADDVWQQQQAALLAHGWPWAPFVGSRPAAVPASLCITPQLQLKATLAASKVCLRFFVMRKGYEFLLDGFEALWTATAAAHQSGSSLGKQRLSAWATTSSSSSATASAPQTAGTVAAVPTLTAATRSFTGSERGYETANAIPRTCVAQPPAAAAAACTGAAAAAAAQDCCARGLQQWQWEWGEQRCSSQVDERYSGRQLQRMVQKLSAHSWQLMYEGYTAALTARADTLAATLRDYCQQQQQQEQQQQEHTAPASTQLHQAASVPVASGSLHGGAAVEAAQPGLHVAAAAAAAYSDAAAAAALADCAGGILSAVESVSGGVGAGEMLAAEPEVLLAATCRGRRPSLGVALWLAVLRVWDTYKHWLDLTVTRCALLGARVAAARQLADPPPMSSAGRGAAGTASTVPHLRNKGLMVFRSQVLLCYKLRRPLQQAALWLAATASVDAASWRAGYGLTDADIDVLTRVRKLLRELDVGDDASEAVGMHTHGKFRRCFGALLTKDRRGLVSSYWMG